MYFSEYKILELLLYFLKPKILTFHQIKLYRVTEIQDQLQTIQGTIEFSTNFINTLFVYPQLFVIKKWVKIHLVLNQAISDC
jgi:hypothetical protein